MTVAFPFVEVALVAAVRGVHADRDPRLVHQLPERVELGEGEGARPEVAVDRCRPDEDDLRPPLEHPLELLDALLHDAEVDHRRREDPVFVVEGPVLVHPLVQRMDDGMDGFGIAPQALLEQAGQCRPHERPIDAQLVHQLDPGLGGHEAGQGPDGLAHDLPARLALGVAVLEVVLLSAGSGDHLEGGVGDVVADQTIDRDLGAAVDLDVADQTVVLLGQVLGEHVGGLVHVVVSVEDREVQHTRSHCLAFLSAVLVSAAPPVPTAGWREAQLLLLQPHTEPGSHRSSTPGQGGNAIFGPAAWEDARR